jgi:flagellar hook assembly protein FlgD
MLGAGEIRFSLAEGIARFDLALFDLSGRLVRDLGGYEVAPGSHHVHWDGRSESGQEMPTGVYFVRVTGVGISETSKVLVRR